MLFLFQAHLCFIPCVTWKKIFSLKPHTHRKLGGRVSLLLGCCINSYWVNSTKLNLCVPGSPSPKDRLVRNLDGGTEATAVLFWRSSGVRGSICASRVSRMTFWSFSSLLYVLCPVLLHSCQLCWIAGAQVWHQKLDCIARKSQHPCMDPALGPSAGEIQQTLTQAPSCSRMFWLRTHSRQGGWRILLWPFLDLLFAAPPKLCKSTFHSKVLTTVICRHSTFISVFRLRKP